MPIIVSTFDEPLRIHGGERPKASVLSDVMLANGITSATTGQIADYLGIPKDQVRQRMKPLRDRGRMVSPARGLWVPVPPDRRAWGSPEPEAYLDDLMAYLGTDYYVAWLSAAAHHGAAHQAPQRYQIVTSNAVSDRTVGLTRFEFRKRDDVARVPRSRVFRRDGGVMASTPAATMLDLMGDLLEAGGIDNAITTACELALMHGETAAGIDGAYGAERASGSGLDAWGTLDDQLLVASGLHGVGCLRRLGWALERYADYEVPPAFQMAATSGLDVPSPLVPGEPIEGCAIDDRWMLVINADPEPDL